MSLAKRKKPFLYLFNEVALADLDLLRVAEGGDDLSPGDEGQALNAVKVGVLNSHDTLVSEQLGNKNVC